MLSRIKYRLVDLVSMLMLKLPDFVLGRLVGRMTETGKGTDACLKWGCLPLPVHFYSPVPDLDDLRKRQVWNRQSELPGISFCPVEQVELITELGSQFGAECMWPAQASAEDPAAFHTENNSFSFGCAASTHCMIRSLKPNRVIEIGSGNSTKVIASALALNTAETGRTPKYTIIDPYPAKEVIDKCGVDVDLIERRVEETGIDVYSSLEENDILFIDSGHTVKIGADVNFLYLDVLPRVAPGTAVHIHDIPMPFEYPAVYATNPRFRAFWTESYLLQAFLAFNSEFEVLLAMHYLQRTHGDVFRDAFPHCDPTIHRQQAASFWMRRKVVGAQQDGQG